MRRPPQPAQRTVVVRGQVFVGGYFYDPRFGPYPWWPPGGYPFWYFPVYDHRSEVRIAATPKAAAVYVDGFYAGNVDDFDGIFQGLPLPPGGHTIALYLDGFRTTVHHVYLRPGSTFTLRVAMAPLRPGERGELPALAPPVPRPPAGTYREPRPPSDAPAPPRLPPAGETTPGVETFGWLDVTVQPSTSELSIDGERWISSDEGHYVVRLRSGRHRVDVTRPGHRTASLEVDIQTEGTATLHVSLVPET